MKLSTLSLIALIPFSQLLLTTSAFAQDWDTSNSYPIDPGLADGGLFFSVFGIGYCVLLILGFAFYIWVVVWTYKDATKRNNPHALLWGLLVLFFGFLPFLIYLLIRKSYPEPKNTHAQ
ncbi:PLDc N-terminal domain-containing protein [Candidatus Dojkabacteria bacterium]|uniref:PLDc N-terminal domain-containing protein n=1 Tax=Candidatus Dojkabacteria bacterium TaxID=2099670 RepID=A0A955RIC7_9BACT|nr:PLDc N-terminal domain-containing protein [Candidatus Dojkabacteria bacterium]